MGQSPWPAAPRNPRPEIVTGVSGAGTDDLRIELADQKVLAVTLTADDAYRVRAENPIAMTWTVPTALRTEPRRSASTAAPGTTGRCQQLDHSDPIEAAVFLSAQGRGIGLTPEMLAASAEQVS